MNVPLYAWFAVLGALAIALALDLFVFHRDAHEVSPREAGITSAIWVGLGLSFGGLVYAVWGADRAGEYLAGYLIEKSLSVDNVFVFALLLGWFAVPPRLQHRVLFWGVVGALVLRGVFIAAGAAFLDSFHWAIYVFGGVLVVSGVRMAMHRDTHVDPGRNPMVRILRRVVPVTADFEGQRFFIRRDARLFATPLLAVLVAIESADVVFAVDSIPAIFAVTDEPFLVFTSNAFAILGLRALYFLLAGVMDRFVYLKVGLAAVLVFVGLKMLLADVYHVPVWASLLAIAVVLGVSIVASLRATEATEATAPAVTEEAV
jgi:tellurite resistance protein TerC